MIMGIPPQTYVAGRRVSHGEIRLEGFELKK